MMRSGGEVARGFAQLKGQGAGDTLRDDSMAYEERFCNDDHAACTRHADAAPWVKPWKGTNGQVMAAGPLMRTVRTQPSGLPRGTYIPGMRRRMDDVTYHSRFIFEGVAEESQIFLLDTRVLPK
jgi:hypothetical protein